MAHYPRFNPNAFNQYRRWSWKNRVISDAFEPGSTFKIFLVAAALESGLCSPRSEFYCENGAYRVGRNVVHDVHPHDTLSLQDILKYSSNIGAAKVGETVGSAYFYDKLQDFGFGKTFDIGFPGETRGRLRPFRRWTNIDARAICFGQGVAVSALQLGAALSAIANDGLLMKPYLVNEVTNARGRVVEAFQPTPLRQVISPENAWRLRHMMQRTVEKGGTGTRAALRGYAVGGKTGTAQKADPRGGGYSEDKYMASFVGFAPVESPEVVTIVVIDEPKGSHYGGVVAAPVFRKIVGKTLRYLKVPPELATPELTDHSSDQPGEDSDEQTEEALRIS
jgi:cell division protein FtsI (penicillin-binding protein 3)